METILTYIPIIHFVVIAGVIAWLVRNIKAVKVKVEAQKKNYQCTITDLQRYCGTHNLYANRYGVLRRARHAGAFKGPQLAQSAVAHRLYPNPSAASCPDDA